MDTTVHYKEPSGQTSSLYTVPVTIILEITYAFTTTIPPPLPSFNPLLQQTTPTPTPTTSEVTTVFPALPDFASVFRFNDRVANLERNLSEMKQVDQKEHIDLIDTLVRSIIKEEVNSQLPQSVSEFATHSTYEATTSLSVFELTKILMDKMEEHKSYLRVDYKRELYDALIKSYNTDKDLFDTYGEVFTVKRSRDDKDKDQDTSSANVEEPSHTVGDSGVQQNQEFDTGNNDEQPDNKAASKVDWFKKPERPPTPDPDWNKRQHVDFKPPQTWISSKDVYSRKCIIAVTSLTIMKRYDYGHLDEIEVRREDQQLYKFKEALSKKVNVESGEVHWWKRIRRRPQTTYKDNMTPSYLVLLHFRSFFHNYESCEYVNK
ncbi:hypothetical protein Tco_1397181 [Tanacetum coccineum]